MNEFIISFCDLLDDTDPSAINNDTKFKELDEWSSLVALSLIAMVDENYNVTLDAEDIRKAITLAELYNIIKEK